MPRLLFAYAMLRREGLRRREDSQLGASAIEWAIITGILASIAIAIGLVIFNKVKDAGDNIKIGNGSGNGGR